MESMFLEFLEKLLPGLGTALSILIVCGGAIIICYKKLKKKIEEHDSKIVQTAESNTNEEEFKNDMKELAKTVKNMADQLEAVSTQVNDVKTNSESIDASILKKMETYEESNNRINAKIDTLHDNMNMLIDSDKESIRSFITIQYYEAINKGYIEIYKLEALECRYEKYLKENGDSFIAKLVEELRTLPHQASSNNS